MINLNALKGKLTEKETTYSTCANVLGISTATFCDKMNGKTKFYVEEANALSDFLGLSNTERISIFFS